jgi:hypothetical protein
LKIRDSVSCRRILRYNTAREIFISLVRAETFSPLSMRFTVSIFSARLNARTFF